MRFVFRFLTVGLIALVLITTVTAIAATNTIPATRLTNQYFSISVNTLKPAACSGISLTSMVSGTGMISGTSGNDLILGSSAMDMIDGGGGHDCILGGGGIDTISGNSGNDVCLGGDGLDIFMTCETQSQ